MCCSLLPPSIYSNYINYESFVVGDVAYGFKFVRYRIHCILCLNRVYAGTLKSTFDGLRLQYDDRATPESVCCGFILFSRSPDRPCD